MQGTENILLIVFGIIEFVLIVLIGVLGWALKSLFNNISLKLSTLTETLEEMTEKFVEHQIIDAGNAQVVIQIKQDVANNNSRLNRHSEKLDKLDSRVHTLEIKAGK